jgi:hypothetical protein
MLNIDNLTVVYLTVLVCLLYGTIQAVTLRDEQHSSRIWVLAQLFFGFGFAGLVYFGKDPLTKYWIGSYALIVLGGLTQLTAIARFGKNPIPKVPALGCLIFLTMVVFLFESTRMLGAPLSSLETLLFTPMVAIYIYMAWFSGKMGDISHSRYLKLISLALWPYAILMVLALLVSLFGLGRGLIDVNSPEIGILAVASLALSLICNYLWSVQAAELSETNINLINFNIALEAKARAVPVFQDAPRKRFQIKLPINAIKAVKSEEKKEVAYGGDLQGEQGVEVDVGLPSSGPTSRV